MTGAFRFWFLPALSACLSCPAPGAAAPARVPYRPLVHPQTMQRLDCAMPDASNRFVTSSAPGQLFLPGETVGVSLAFRPDPLTGTNDLYAVEVRELVQRLPEKADPALAGIDDFGPPDLMRPVGAPLRVPIPAPVFTNASETRLEVRDFPLPARFGTYALILCRRRAGETADFNRRFLSTLARVPLPDPNAGVDDVLILGEGQFFTGQARDTLEQRLARGAAYARLGIRGMRCELGWNANSNGTPDWTACDALFTAAASNGIRIMVTLGGTPPWTWPFAPSQTPAACPSNWDGNPYSGRADWLSAPAFDNRYGAWITDFCRRYWQDGKGALWGLEHYNEPWEGGGISGWAGDMQRYRTLLRLIKSSASAVSPEIRVFAASSVMNTEDKLYSDGTRGADAEFDVFTDHYVRPALSYGPMAAAARGKASMDTESWIVNSEYRLPLGACSFAACGQRHVNPWHPRALFDTVPGSRDKYLIPTPTAVATAAFNALTSGRPFKRIVFRDHLPWLFQFGEDDDPAGLLVLFGQLVTIGSRSPAENAAERPWAQVDGAAGGEIEIDNQDRLLALLDLAGNPLSNTAGRLTLPMTYLPTYIQCLQGPAAAAERIRAAVIRGKRPVEIVPMDFDAPIGTPGAVLRVKVHNVLPQRVKGTLSVRPSPAIQLTSNSCPLALEAGEQRVAAFVISSGRPDPGNAYPFGFSFDSDAGPAAWSETLNAAVARHRTIQVDGKLDEWSDLPGIFLLAHQEQADISEQARQPWLDGLDKMPAGNFAEVKLAWDSTNLYVAARVNDPTPEMDKPRRSAIRENDWFHGASSDTMEPYRAWLERTRGCDGRTLKEAGRSFSEVSHIYRRRPSAMLPCMGDRLQFAFDVVGGWHDLEPNTNTVPFGFTAVPDTDYEYALYRCEDDGSELWRLLAPGVPRVHDFPRQPKPEKGPRTGPVDGARHVVIQEGAVRIYEASIPRGEIPDLVFAAGTSFGFVFMAGNNQGPSIRYGEGKAACKLNGLTLHPYWLASPDGGIRWTLTE